MTYCNLFPNVRNHEEDYSFGFDGFYVNRKLGSTESSFPTSKPEAVGLSSDRLNRIKPVMQRYVDDNKLPGIITMVARHGKIVHFERYGMMDVDKPMQLNTIFSIQSMTKPITSVAVMMLYEEGLFQLDDPVAKYIPEFKDLEGFFIQR